MATNDQNTVSQFPLPPSAYIASPLPPPPPPKTSYEMFGRTYLTSDPAPDLSASSRPTLYSPTDAPTASLRTLNAALISLFAALLGALASAAAHAPLVARLEDALINMHHILNTLRPAQAARDLRVLLAAQAAARAEMSTSLASAVATATADIAAAAAVLAAPTDDPAVAAALAVAAAHIGDYNRGAAAVVTSADDDGSASDAREQFDAGVHPNALAKFTAELERE